MTTPVHGVDIASKILYNTSEYQVLLGISIEVGTSQWLLFIQSILKRGTDDEAVLCGCPSIYSLIHRSGKLFQ